MTQLLQARPTDLLISALVSAPVVAAVARGHELECDLFEAEEAALGTAVNSRRREFVTARACAREALAILGHPVVAIASGPAGEPLWPEGVVGSITHCDGLRACALAPATAVAAIGLDAEVNQPLPPGVLASVASATERLALPAADGVVHWDRLLFSAKEAAYKAWFAMTGRMLGFEDAAVIVSATTGTFTARAMDGIEPDLEGRWAADASHLATIVVAPR